MQNWNGKFQSVGNGGTAGVIGYNAMAAALNRGYATASTDTGHVPDSPLRAATFLIAGKRQEFRSKRRVQL